MSDLIIKNIAKAFCPKENKVGQFKIIENANIVIQDGIITDVLSNNVSINARILEKFEILDAKNLCALPGFVDSHAHPVFAETREMEFEMRNQGKSYLEIAKSGGGIKNSVRKLRRLSFETLYERSKKRALKFLATGTTTVEAKSGYGLTLNDEIKMLEVIKKLNEETDLDLVPTFLGAHEVPEEYTFNREGYISLIMDKMLPLVKEKNLAEACDIFIEKNVYTLEEGERILTRAKELGFEVKIHADQLTCNNGSLLAAKLGALSADHLEFISEEAIEAMIAAGVVFNFLPGATYFVGIDTYPPARKIIDKGGIISLATDFNPGTCHITSMPIIMNIGAIKMHLSAEELVWAATMGGAKALKKDKIGNLNKNSKADIILMDITKLEEIPYYLGDNLVKKVIKNGKVII